MCGFVGFVSDGENKKEIVESMLKTIYHRGPDSQESYTDEQIALGFARLSIVGVEGGNQPIYNEDRSKVIVFNGEIYNFRDLKAELLEKGHEFYTATDTEVLIHGYEEWDAGLLDRLRGMYSFAIWDKEKGKLFGARDHFGIKPYYYTKMGETFIFGSEIKSFLPHPDFRKELNVNRLPDYMTFGYVPDMETFFKDVYMLPPGHYFEYEKGELSINQYWEPIFTEDESKTFEELVDEVHASIKESVKAHQFADVEVGSFLSGGVDSSIVACELSKLQPVKTYTIGFEDPKYSEAADAKVLAEEIGAENYERRVTAEEYFGHAGDVQYHLDEPLANPSANLLYFVSQRAAEDVKVVMSGEGSDEMYGGYNEYLIPTRMGAYGKLPAGLRSGISRLCEHLPRFKGRNFLERSGRPEDIYIGITKSFYEYEVPRYLKGNYPVHKVSYFTKKYFDKVKGHGDITRMQYLDINMWMLQEILLKADKMSMAQSLELRVPLLDIEIWNTSKNIPDRFKSDGTNTKLVMRAASKREINPITSEREKKPFPLPLDKWLREDKWYNLVKGYFTNDIARELFNTDELLKLLEEHRSGKTHRVNRIWTVFSFLLWYEEFFTKRSA